MNRQPEGSAGPGLTLRRLHPASGVLRHLDPWLIAAAALALIPALAIARPGIPHTADGYVHILRTLEVSQLLRAGVLYPRWAPDFYLGYGYPFFNFYAGGSHWLAAVAGLAGLGVLAGVVALQVASLVFYPTGAYLAARSLYPAPAGGRTARPAALVCAALYLYAPLRFRELFIQGNLSQLVALALLPWCAWLLTEAARRGDLRRSAVAGVTLAGLVYAHHPSAFLGFPFLAVYAFAVALIARRGASTGRRLAAVAAAFAIGILLSAPFWLPAVVELRDVNISAIETGMFNARLNLLPLAELFSTARVLDDAALNPAQPNSLGIAQFIMALGGLAVALKWALAPARRQQAGDAMTEPLWMQRQAGWTLLVAVGLLTLSLVLMLPQAAPAWERLPLARFIAFPWRLLGPALLLAALLGGAAFYLVPPRLRTTGLAVLLVLIPFSVAPYLFPRSFAAVTELTVADIARYELEGGARATASANEYLPRWVADPNPPTDLAEALREGREVDPLDRASLPPDSMAVRIGGGPLGDSYRLDLPVATTVRIRRFYFPGWRAWVDGRPVAVTPGSPYGLIEVSVPAGAHELEVRFAATPSRITGNVLAFAGLVGAIALWWAGGKRQRGNEAEDGGKEERAQWQLAMLALATILVVTAVVTLVIGPHTRWFRQRSPEAAPATMQHPLHVRFANGIELIGYDLEDDAPRQGETLGVRLYWRALAPQAANVRPFVHLDAITGDATWANQTKVHPGDKPSTRWTPGFYVIDDYRMLVPADTPPLVANLQAGLIEPSGKLVPLIVGGDTATLAEIGIRERRPLALEAVPGREQSYQLGEAVRLVGHSITVTETLSASGARAPALDVTLYWRAESKLPADYTVFVNVFDGRGQKITQIDGQPSGGRYPSSAWTPGQIVVDTRRISLPAGINTADLRVGVGLYTLSDGARLVVTDEQGARLAGDEILFAPVAP